MQWHALLPSIPHGQYLRFTLLWALRASTMLKIGDHRQISYPLSCSFHFHSLSLNHGPPSPLSQQKSIIADMKETVCRVPDSPYTGGHACVDQLHNAFVRIMLNVSIQVPSIHMHAWRNPEGALGMPRDRRASLRRLECAYTGMHAAYRSTVTVRPYARVAVLETCLRSRDDDPVPSVFSNLPLMKSCLGGCRV